MFTRCHKSFWQSELCKAIQSSLRKESARCDYTTVVWFIQQTICVYEMEQCFVRPHTHGKWGQAGGCTIFYELLKRIECTGIGCHIGHHFYGGLGYAEDVVLLSPTVRGLQLLINTCEKFPTKHNVTFNSRKTVCTYFGSRNIIACREASLNSVKIPWQTSVKHLGNYLNYDLSDEIDIGKKRGDFIAAVNRLNSVFSTVQSEVKLSLLQTYCTAWYGCQAWQLGTTLADKMNVEW